MFENVVTSGKTDKARVLEFICYLKEETLDLNFESFASNGAIVDDAKDYQWKERKTKTWFRWLVTTYRNIFIHALFLCTLPHRNVFSLKGGDN